MKLTEDITNKMNDSSGVVEFKYYPPAQFFDVESSGKIINDIVSGENIFILEKEAKNVVVFYFSRPSIGSWEASIDINELLNAEYLHFFLAWNEEWNEHCIMLSIGGTPDKYPLFKVKGKVSKKTIRIGNDGAIYSVGDKNMNVINYTVMTDNGIILELSALEYWKSSLIALDTLLTGKSDQGYMFEVVISNMAILILVTGFEQYCKKRFIETEKENPRIDIQKILKFINKEHDPNYSSINNGVELLEKIFQSKRRLINFQSLKEANEAYKKGYGIGFYNDLALSTQEIKEIEQFIEHRHIVIHVSPLRGIVNKEKIMHGENPVFSNDKTFSHAKELFNKFITNLHAVTSSKKIY